MENGLFLEFGIKLRLSLEHGIKPLNGGNTDPAHQVKGIGGEVLDIVKLCKLSAIIRGYILLTFSSGLPSQVTPINQEKDPFRISEFYQTVNEAYGSISLAATGRHLDKRSRPGYCKGLLKVFDGFDLTIQ